LFNSVAVFSVLKVQLKKFYTNGWYQIESSTKEHVHRRRKKQNCYKRYETFSYRTL